MAKATRVHSTPRRSASKIKPKSSAVSKVQKSGLDVVPTKKTRAKSATLREYAKIDWKPWRRTPDMSPTELMPSREQTDHIGVGCRIAYGLMLKTRKELIAVHGDVAHEHMDKLMGNLTETAEWLKAMAYMIEAAYVRVVASAAAAHIKGVKFKGVDYKPSRRKAVK